MTSEGYGKLIPQGIGAATITLTVKRCTDSVNITVAYSPSSINESGDVAVIEDEESLIDTIDDSSVPGASVVLDVSESD